MSRIRTIWGMVVNRWHSHPSHKLRDSGDRTDGHHGRCVQLLLLLHPNPDVDLIRRVAFHDTCESGLGDVSGGAKRKNAALAVILRHIENERAVALGLPQMLDDDPWLDLVDRLDAWLWVRTRDPSVFANGAWHKTVDDINRLADLLGVGDQVRGVLRG